MTMRFLLLIFAISSSQACAPCDCTVPYTMMCRNLSEFPTFSEEERKQTALLDITESSLEILPTFTKADWPVLDVVTLWNNSDNVCESSGWQGDILLDNHDCLPHLPMIEVCLPDESQEQSNLVLGQSMVGGMLPTALLIMLIAIVRALKLYQQRQHAPAEPINTTNNIELQQL